MKLPRLSSVRSAPLASRERARLAAEVAPAGCNPLTCKGRCDCAYDACKAAGLPLCDVARSACHLYCDS
jgi:hypothetical protein